METEEVNKPLAKKKHAQCQNPNIRHTRKMKTDEKDVVDHKKTQVSPRSSFKVSEGSKTDDVTEK